jgi:thiosulfate/3-mercaptopyruvate sulfurtransferase
MTNPHLISVEELAQSIDNPSLRILDASWYLPAQNRDAKAEYNKGHIKGAQFFDIDAMSDETSPLPHMLMGAKDFAKALGQMGISEQNEIIVYDGMGLFSAARVWWNLRIMGANSVRILDGGLPAWKAANLPLDKNGVELPITTFNPSLNAGAIVDHDQVLNAITHGSHEILDARSHDRFTAKVKEPREGLKSGHMPGAKSLPFDSLLKDGHLLPVEQLREKLQAIGFDFAKPALTTCGSGVTAAVLALALETIGKTDYQLYDGSWSEWGALEGVPIAEG